MARDENGRIVSSHGAVKWDLISGEKTPIEVDEFGMILVNPGDVIGFTKDCIPISELHITGYKGNLVNDYWILLQINEDHENPISLEYNVENIIKGVNIRYLVARCKMWLTFWGISFDD